jgi:cysteine desulfurase
MESVAPLYLDHAAATPLSEKAREAMLPFLTEEFGNPSALYALGQQAAAAVDEARTKVAKVLGARPENIIFTSGGTEGDNLALYGLARANQDRGKHIVTLAIEHPAVLEPLRDLERNGFEITYVPVDAGGRVRAKDVIAALRPDTILVSIMYANNEIGTIEPIAEIGRELLKYRQKQKNSLPYLHTDACQAANYLDLSVEKLHVDALVLNGSKLYGPKGSGCLYVRSGVPVQPLMRGGGQEFGLRSGTENVSAIVGFAVALEEASELKNSEAKRLQALAKMFFKNVRAFFPEAVLNGPEIGEERLPNNVHITFPGFEAEQLLLYLSQAGVSCSAASACASQSQEVSHVLTAIGLSQNQANGSVRFSLGRSTTEQKLESAVAILKKVIQQLTI